MRNGLHQLAHLGFKEIIGYDQRADGGPGIAVTGRDRLIDRRFQLAVLDGIGLRALGHGLASCHGASYVLVMF
jgi:hypothetical protein